MGANLHERAVGLSSHLFKTGVDVPEAVTTNELTGLALSFLELRGSLTEKRYTNFTPPVKESQGCFGFRRVRRSGWIREDIQSSGRLVNRIKVRRMKSLDV